MKRIILLFVIFSLSFGNLFSQCTEPSTNKVMLLGDSWGFYMNFEGTINKELKKWGHSNLKYVTTGNLVVNGADTYDFLEAPRQAEIVTLFNQNPDISVVHLSLGGNDFLGDWNKNMTAGQVDTLESEVMFRLDSIIRFLKIAKPGVHIVWSGYCYTNFEEPITKPGILFTGPDHPFYGTWQGMEFPSFLQINTLLNEVSQLMVDYCALDPQLHFVPETGILQYTTGQTSNICCNIQPQGTYQPGTVTMPWGDVNYPSPISTMRDYLGLAKDCFHLSPQGYSDFIGYQMQKFYQKFFMDDLYLLSNNNAQTGTVSSLGNTDSLLYVGEASGEQFATVLSFNTGAMADTTLLKASLFLRRKGLTGTNPVNGSVQVKVKSGNFGATVDVEAADFTALDDASGNPCLFGSNSANGDWVRLDLPASLLSHIIHTASTTQFIVSAPAATGGKIQFYNSSNPEFAPVLNLAYGQAPSAVNEVGAGKEFNIYPNPTNGLLTIETGAESITHLEVSNLLGQVVLLPSIVQNTVNLSTLPSGVYMLNITTQTGKTSQRVVKE